MRTGRSGNLRGNNFRCTLPLGQLLRNYLLQVHAQNNGNVCSRDLHGTELCLIRANSVRLHVMEISLVFRTVTKLLFCLLCLCSCSFSRTATTPSSTSDAPNSSARSSTTSRTKSITGRRCARAKKGLAEFFRSMTSSTCRRSEAEA